MSAQRLTEPVSDGNGGTLDPRTSSDRDFMVALHVKLDEVVIPKLNDLEARMRDQEDGDLSRGQKAAIREVVQEDKDVSVTRRAAKTPVWGLVVSILALATAAALTVVTILQGGGHG